MLLGREILSKGFRLFSRTGIGVKPLCLDGLMMCIKSKPRLVLHIYTRRSGWDVPYAGFCSEESELADLDAARAEWKQAPGFLHVRL